MSIYSEALKEVFNGARFHIDFESRTMKVGGKKIVDNSEYDTTKALYEPVDNVLETIEALYKDYKYSLPSERNDNKRRKYFKALPMDELTDEQIMFGEPRELAQFKLEAFILCAIINGDFVWQEEYGNWFWQSKSDTDLIILKNWVQK